jgi:hypothetical protein
MNLRKKVGFGLLPVCLVGTIWLFVREFHDASNDSSGRVILITWVASWNVIYSSSWLADIKRAQRSWWRHGATLLIFVGASTIGIIMWLDLSLGGSLINNDFTQDYLAGYALRHGSSIYGAPLKALSMELFNFETENFHPPFNALLFVPLSYLPYRSAFLLWSVLSLIGFGVLVLYSLHACGLARYPWLPVSAVLLLWKPFTATVWLGQISLILALLIVFGFYFLKQGRERTAGFLFAVATLIKLFPGFLFLYLVIERRWRCTATLAATVGAGLLISLAVTGWDNSLYYISRILPEQMRLFASFPFNISIEGVMRTIFGPNEYFTPALKLHSHVVKMLVLIIGLFFTVAACTSVFPRSGTADQNAFMLFCITMLLVSPLTWPHTCLILVFAMAMLLRDGIRDGQLGQLRVLIVVFALFSVPDPVILTELTEIYGPGGVPWHVLVASKTGFFALIVLWATFWLRLRRSRPLSPEASILA